METRRASEERRKEGADASKRKERELHFPLGRGEVRESEMGGGDVVDIHTLHNTIY